MRASIFKSAAHDTQGSKNPHDIFINLNSSIEMVLQPKKPKTFPLVKWLVKKGVEKIQEDHQQPITGRNNQIKTLEFIK